MLGLWVMAVLGRRRSRQFHVIHHPIAVPKRFWTVFGFQVIGGLALGTGCSVDIQRLFCTICRFKIANDGWALPDNVPNSHLGSIGPSIITISDVHLSLFLPF